MSIEAFGIPVLLLGLLSLFLKPVFSVYVLIALTLFGAASAVSLPALGGANLTPASLFMPFFVIRFLLWIRPRWDQIVQLKRNTTLKWLLAFTGYALFSVLVLGPLFAGSTKVFMIDRMVEEVGAQVAEPLRFTSGYITQMVYLLAGVCVFIIVMHYKQVPGMLAHIANAVLMLAVLDVGMAALDLATQLTGTQELMEFMRGAAYMQHAGQSETAGLRRVSGSFSEPAAFAAYSMPLMAFCLIAWIFRFRVYVAAPAAIALMAMLGASTSSTAYVSLAAFLATLLGIYVFRLYWSGGKTNRPALLLVVGGTILAVCVAAIMLPAVTDAVMDVLDQTVFSKMETSSGIERGEWNTQALVNLTDTWLLGVGLGGGIASSYPLVLLGNVGIPGFIMFAGIIFTALVPGRRAVPLTDDSQTIERGARAAIFAHLLAAAISARVFDPGLLLFVMIGLAAVFTRSRSQRSSSRELANARRAAAALAGTAGAETAVALPAHLAHAANLSPKARLDAYQQAKRDKRARQQQAAKEARLGPASVSGPPTFGERRGGPVDAMRQRGPSHGAPTTVAPPTSVPAPTVNVAGEVRPMSRFNPLHPSRQRATGRGTSSGRSAPRPGQGHGIEPTRGPHRPRQPNR